MLDVISAKKKKKKTVRKDSMFGGWCEVVGGMNVEDLTEMFWEKTQRKCRRQPSGHLREEEMQSPEAAAIGQVGGTGRRPERLEEQSWGGVGGVVG